MKNYSKSPKRRRTTVALDLLHLEGPFPRSATNSDARSSRTDNAESLSFLIDRVLLAHSNKRPAIPREGLANGRPDLDLR